VDVFSKANLFEELPKGFPSIVERGYVPVCNGGDECQEEFGETFPKYGITVLEFDTQAGTYVWIDHQSISNILLRFSQGTIDLCRNLLLWLKKICKPVLCVSP